ncbi:MAG: hypothetical protein AB8U34_03670, partial [Anaplasma ovis]
LKAIDTKWRSQVAKEAKLELTRIAEELKRAAERCKMLGVIGERTTPSAEMIGVVAQSVICTSTQSLAI